VDEQQIWDHGVRSIKKMFADLPRVKMLQLSELLAVYRQEKENLAAVILRIDSETTCRECAGQCCLNGKYRINVLDLLSHCFADLLVTPDFEQKPLCPYGTVRGCLMEPGFRPADCIRFICDALDVQLSVLDRSALNVREKALRDCLRSATHLLGMPTATPMLLWAEKISIPINSYIKEA
jgi:hypothetical protein